MRKFFLLLLFVFISDIYSQKEVEYFPDDLTLKPFSANILEPKMGFLFDIGKNELRLDVGNSMDILKINYPSVSSLSFGVDFFTYSFLQRRKDFKFPVVAIDYLFGLNSVYKIKRDDYSYGIRTRLSHISAHFVDGHYNIVVDKWRDNIEPFVYSKEFFEFTPFYQTKDFRLYATLTLIYHIKPSELGADAYQIGGEYFFQNVFNENVHVFFSSDLKISHLDDYNLSFNFQSGLKFGDIYSKNSTIYFQFYSGKNIHGELFNQNVRKISVGINFDL